MRELSKTTIRVRFARHTVGRWFAVGLLWALPDTAWACPVCFSAKNEAGRVAYLAMTGLMTFLPLIVLGTSFYLIKRYIEKNEDAA